MKEKRRVQNMYIKLAEKCKIFQLHGINMIGCSITHKIIGLTEAGYEFVQELKRGVDVDCESLSEDIKQLYEVMKKNNFFEMKEEGGFSYVISVQRR